MKITKIIYTFLFLSIITACSNNSNKADDEIFINKTEIKSTDTPTHKVIVLKNDKPFMAFESPYSDFLLNKGYLTMSLFEKDDVKKDASSILLVAQNVTIGTFPIYNGGLGMKEGQPRVVIDEQKNGQATNATLLITEGTVTITSFDGKSISGNIKGTGNVMEDNSKLSIEASFNMLMVLGAVRLLWR